MGTDIIFMGPFQQIITLFQWRSQKFGLGVHLDIFG